MKFVEKTRKVTNDFFDLVLSLPQKKIVNLMQFLIDLRDLKTANQKEDFREMHTFLISKNQDFRELFAWFIHMSDAEFNERIQTIHLHRLTNGGTFKQTKM